MHCVKSIFIKTYLCFRLRRDCLFAVDLPQRHGVKILQPAISSLSSFKTEYASVDDVSYFDLTVATLDDLGSVVELSDQTQNTLPLLHRYHVDLVEHDDICKLDLIDHEI